MQNDPSTPSREEIQRQLEVLREKLTPQQYRVASARLLDQLERANERKPKYAIT